MKCAVLAPLLLVIVGILLAVTGAIGRWYVLPAVIRNEVTRVGVPCFTFLRVFFSANAIACQ